MGFTVNYGMPGLLGIAFLAIGVGAAVILLRFLLSAGEAARAEVIDDESDLDG